MWLLEFVILKWSRAQHNPISNLASKGSISNHNLLWFLDMILDTKLDFQEHLKGKLGKISKTIRLLRKLPKILTRPPLLTIYKSFIRSHLDYSNIIYDKAWSTSFHQNIEKIKYNSALAVTGAIRGTFKKKLYQELESPEKRRWYWKLYYFYEIFNKQFPKYLLNIIPVGSRSYFTRYVENVPSFKVRHDFFQKFLFSFYCNWME